jgi:hypothetical protein
VAALTNNQVYLVTIRKGSGGDLIQANAMSKLGLMIENRWVNVLEALGFSGSSGGLLGLAADAANAGQIFTGSNFLPNLATTQVWRGSGGIELELQMRFDAWDDPVKDVLKPVQSLIQLFAPYRGDGDFSIPGVDVQYGSWFLHPPGPTPKEYISGEANDKLITVTLGKVMHIGNLVPVRFQWEFEERYVKEGDPVCALVTASFMSYSLPDRNELLAMFFRQAVGGSSGGLGQLTGSVSVNPNP